MDKLITKSNLKLVIEAEQLQIDKLNSDIKQIKIDSSNNQEETVREYLEELHTNYEYDIIPLLMEFGIIEPVVDANNNILIVDNFIYIL